MRIGHVHLKVRNLHRAEEFYRELLGAQISERVGDTYCFLTLGSSHHELALQEVGESASISSSQMAGLYHTAFEVGDSAELLSAIERLDRRGISYVIVDHGISWAVYFADPDSNGVEIYLDRRIAADGRGIWGGVSRELSKGEIRAAIEASLNPAS